MKIIITRGLPASGKSTWSKKYVEEHTDFVRLSRDDLRFMIHNGFMVEDDKRVLAAREALLFWFISKGYNIIIDETFLAPNRVKELREEIANCASFAEVRPSIEIKDFLDVPLEECLERNKTRGLNEKVPEEFIRKYYEKYVKPLLDKQKKSMI